MRADEAREQVQNRREVGKQAEREERLEHDKRTICNIFVKFPSGESKTVVREAAGIHTSRFNPAFAALVDKGSVVPCEIIRSNRKTPYAGFTLAEDTTHE